ncbi:MAG: hypothetical protein LBI31_03265 [Zoogloeaceae bacterium]|jgi:hypothetical protein|nr:hypothetical protein [Zoogloeaceae bacterium]
MPRRNFADALTRLAKTAFCVGLLMLALSWFFVDDLPSPAKLLPDLVQAPIQNPTSAPAFTTNLNGVSYRIKPLYTYELWGLVVSTHHSDSWWDNMHRDTGDFLNVMDLCVVWGKNNALSGIYEKFSFSSGQFTCYYSTSNQEAWSRFVNEELSNNHILVADKEAGRRMKQVRTGDQIHLRGYLVEYQNSQGAYRGSSTVRTDTGNGACETVFVEAFDVLRRSSRLGLTLCWLGVSLILISILSFIASSCIPERWN